jgi:protein ImuB
MQRSSESNSTAAKDREAEIQQILAILHKWGIHTLGQFAALDKEQVGARLGPEAVRMWERANGQSNRLLKLVRPPESFQESFEFENEIETAEPLLFMLRRFLEQLSLRLSAIYLVAKELTLRITFANPPAVRWDGFAGANKQQYKRVFKIPQPTNDIELLFRMLHTHLENFKSEYPITAVSLEAQPTKPPKQQFGLFEMTLRNPHQLPETLARLTALLGADRVGTPVLEETHRPDAFRMEPFVWNLSADTKGAGFPHRRAGSRAPLPEGESRVRASETASTSGAALRRFRPVAGASVFISEDRHLQSEIIRGKVVDQRGPYLLSGNWWDKTAWSHAEWDLELENNILVRCHQSSPSVAAATSGVAGGETWEIDGIYD